MISNQIICLAIEMSAADVVSKNLKMGFEKFLKMNWSGNLFSSFKATINGTLYKDSVHTSEGNQCASVRNSNG